MLFKTQGNTLTQQLDGTWQRNPRYRREDVSISLDPNDFQAGNHYKITVTHNMKSTGGGFWNGKGLHAEIKKSGPAKKIPTIATYLSPREIHIELCKRLRLAIGGNFEDIHFFEKTFMSSVIDEKYNRALRRLCTGKNPKIPELIRIMLDYQDTLGVSANEKNNLGKSAMTYAREKNIPAIINALGEQDVPESRVSPRP